MIIGEAPGQREDDSGKPFVGRSGKLLLSLLSDINLTRADCYITNAVHCRPPDNRTPKKAEIAACKKWLQYEIACVKPKYILTLGNVPLQAILGVTGVKKHRGKPVEKDGMVILPTFHPAFALRDERQRLVIEKDLRTFRDIIDFGGIPEERDLNYTIVDTWRKFDEMLGEMVGTVSFDLETSGLYPWKKYSYITSLVVGVRDRQFVVPVNHSKLVLGKEKWYQPTGVTSVEELRTISAVHKKHQQKMWDRFIPKLNECEIVVQNGKFDALWVLVLTGHRIHLDFDTMLAHYLINENALHDLEYLSGLYFGAPGYDITTLEKNGIGSLDRHCKYAASDGFYTRKLKYRLLEELKKDLNVKRVFDKLMMPVANMFVEIEHHGVYINEDGMDDAREYLQGEAAAAQKEWDKYGKGVNMRSPKQIADLFFKKLKIPIVEKTKKGAPSTSESVLKRIDHPAAQALLKFRGAAQQLSFFIGNTDESGKVTGGWKEFIVNGRMHPSFKLHGTVTGRPSCIRKGTQIQVPGGTKSIEGLQIGDWVYSFDENKQLTLKRVKNKWYRGRKKIKRLHWQGKGGHHSGFLDVTMDHRIRTVDGYYIFASNIKGGKKRFSRGQYRYHGGEHILALHRQSDERNYLYCTGYPSKLREARVVFESINGFSPEHVHHKDENSLNDSPKNLVGMTHSEHISLHQKQVMSLNGEARRRMMKRDKETVKRVQRGVSAALKQKTENRFTRQEIVKALELGNGILGAKKILGCSYEAVKRRIDEWGIPQFDGRKNHIITRVELLEGSYPVYDIEVEDTNNFIANELCVHNCENPNLQQVPRDERIRSLITAPEGWTLLDADLSQIELRIAAWLADETNMIRMFNTGIDVHWMTCLNDLARGAGEADLVKRTAIALDRASVKSIKRKAKQLSSQMNYGDAIEILRRAGPDAAVEVDKAWKELRKKAKAVNFGFLYGMWWKKFKIYARDNYGVAVTDSEAQDSRITFFETFPGFAKRDRNGNETGWHVRQKRYAQMNGFVRSPFGRKRRLPAAMGREDTPERAEAQRQAINSPVQSCASDLNLSAALQLRKEFSHDVLHIVGTVHDAILLEVRDDYVKKVAKRLLEIMQRPALLDVFEIDIPVPLCGEIKAGPWSRGRAITF